MADNRSKIIHPGITDSRVLTYLNVRTEKHYENTELEDILLQLWREKYYIAKAFYNQSRAGSEKVNYWRRAFEGKFNKLDENGEITEERIKAIRKLAYELVESKVNAHIPAPKMTPRYHADIVPVNATEKLIKHEMDKMLSEQSNDEAEHHVLIDGTVWFKVSWDPFDNTHERSGNPVVTACPIDTVYPQPGVRDYKDMEYIFEETELTLAQCIDLFNREIWSPDENDIVPIVNCYFLNEDRYVGRFSWCEQTGTVLCNDLEWGIRKRRECVKCHTEVNIEAECPICGGKKFHYVPVKEFKLEEDLIAVTNPYRSGQSDNSEDDVNQINELNTIPAGTTIPHYLIRQLPFVPYRRVSVPNSIYGISEVELTLEDQDIINKLLNKAERKSNQSKVYVTKLKQTLMTEDDEISKIEIDDANEGAAIQVKQVMADISEEITEAQVLYDIAKSTVGVTNTDQGKEDTTARSGKAKQLQMQASAQRNVGPTTMRNLAYSGVYELIFKNLLAYCDEERSFVSLLPDGSQTEEVWSKFMFLSRDDNGEFYYRDDFAWSVDTATEITEDRAAMWQLIDNDFINGTLGTQIDPGKALLMYWQMKEQTGYPLAKYALSFMKDTMSHLPSQVEQALVSNPDAVDLALNFIQDKMTGNMGQNGSGTVSNPTGQRGGARPNAGREGNGATHSANVEKTNNKNRTQSGAGQTNTNAVATGGMQGGTGGVR